jgi:hypothetical protein
LKGHGETVTNILIDLNSFWTHENRERLVVEPSSSTPTTSSGLSNSSSIPSEEELFAKAAKQESDK